MSPQPIPNTLFHHHTNQFHLGQRGYTLYLVLLVLSIAAILFSITLKDTLGTERLANEEVLRVQTRLLAESGVVRAEYFLNGGDGYGMEWETEALEENLDSSGIIRIVNRRFGGYTYLISRGIRRRVVCTIHGLFGRDMPATLKPSITLTGALGNLILESGSTIEGTVVIHHGQVRRGLRGSAVSGVTLITRSSPSLPFDSMQVPQMVKFLSTRFGSLISSPNQITGSIALSQSNDSLCAKSPLVVFGDCTISDITMELKTIVVTGELTIKANTSLDGCELLAGKISIGDCQTEKCLFYSGGPIKIDGGEHNSQFISQDSINTSEHARFDNLSLWVSVLDRLPDSSMVGGLRFGNNSKISGTAICCNYKPGKPVSGKDAIVFGDRCIIEGAVITDGVVVLQNATVKGHVWARTLLAKKGKDYAVNFLIGTTIAGLKGTLPFPILGEPPAKIRFEKTALGYGPERQRPEARSQRGQKDRKTEGQEDRKTEAGNLGLTFGKTRFRSSAVPIVITPPKSPAGGLVRCCE